MRKNAFVLALILSLAAFVLCSCGEGGTTEYSITFKVDGAEYACIKTSGNATLQMPSEPSKDGYIFDGWYLDYGVFENEFTSNSLINSAMTDDVEVYAKWIPQGSLTGTEINTCLFSKNGTELRVTVGAEVESFCFANEIYTADGASFTVSESDDGSNSIELKTVILSRGDNIYYVTVKNRDEVKVYTAVIHRNLMYEIKFYADGGVLTDSQMVEEGKFATKPASPVKTGYIFCGWEMDFESPVTENKTVNAIWNECTHQEAEITVENEVKATCLKEGSYDSVFYCKKCGKHEITKMTEQQLEHVPKIPVKKNVREATCYSEGGYDMVTQCSVCFNEIEKNHFTVDRKEHIYENSKCTVCRGSVSSLGLQFELNGNGGYTLIGKGDCNESDIVIGLYNELPVTAIKNEAFLGCDFISSVSFGERSFVERLGKRVFSGCTAIEEIILPDSVKSIGEECFLNCKSIKKIVISNSVQSLNKATFSGCEALDFVVIGSSVTVIEKNNFYGCSYPNLLYNGTKNSWSKIKIGANNGEYRKVYYYSEQKPTDKSEGYWGYCEGEPKIWSDYKITSISFNNRLISGNKIILPISNKYIHAAAERLRDVIYENTGYTYTIYGSDSYSGYGNVLFKTVDVSDVPGGLRISIDSEGQFLIECAYINKLEDAIIDFLNEKIVSASGDVDFSGELYTTDISVVYYSDFGAVGDGVTDDFLALKAAHDFANISGQTVKADAGKTYRIHKTRNLSKVEYISIKTNVDWTGAEFIIDDSTLSTFDGTNMHSGWIFVVESDYSNFNITSSSTLRKLAGIGEGTEKINLALGYPAMLTVYNENHRVYRRKGYSSQDGAYQHEIILVDKNGNVDKSTPFMFDYETVTKVTVHRTDVKPITVKGGMFTTVASGVNIYDASSGSFRGDGYFARGIMVRRPYTVLDGIEHYVTGEIPLNAQSGTNCGVAYTGFFYAENTSDVLFKNLVLTGRRCYKKSTGGTKGTYDFGANAVNGIRLEGCIQSNFYMIASVDMDVTTTYKEQKSDGSLVFGIESAGKRYPGFTVVKDSNGVPVITKEATSVLSMSDNPSLAAGRICWGIGGTNYCKNMEYINSVLSRFDAHCGLYNGKVIGSTVTFVSLVGKGEFIFENSTWIAPDDGKANNSLIYLRDDYGSPWNGTVILKKIIAINHKSGNRISDFGIVFHNYENWYYGYECHFPSFVIDNLYLSNMSDGSTVNLVFPGCSVINSDIHLDMLGGVKNENPVVPPKFIKIVNNSHGYKLYIPNNNFFSKTDLSECQEGSYER